MTLENLSRRGALTLGGAGGLLLASDGAALARQSDPDPAAKLAELGVALPKIGPALGSYAPFVREGRLVFVSGQLPMRDGKLISMGLVPGAVSLVDAQAAARQCAINILAVMAAACDGDLSKISACLKLTGYVACDATFTDQPKVINGASDLMKAVFGAKGQHARAAVGVSALPLGAPVEVEAIFSLKA